MNALLEHQWGISSAQDRVWAQVTGMAPDRAVRQPLMALEFQAFIDDSARPPDGDFVLAGHIATAEAWAHFAKDWEELLPLGTLAKNGQRHFKMSEMARSPEGRERTELFYRVIEKYVSVSISYRMNMGDFTRALARAHGPNSLMARLGWSFDFFKFENPYFFMFRGLMDDFHRYARHQLKDIIPLDETVDFIFDDRSEKSYILAGWDEYVSELPEEEKQLYGATPRFQNDQRFLPLQAADLWAWWVREWYEEDAALLPDKMRDLDFGGWRGRGRRLYLYPHDEDSIVSSFEAILFGQVALNDARGSSFRLVKKRDEK